MLDEELAAAPHTALQGDQGSLTLAAGWPMASPVFNQGRNHTANPGEKRFRARSRAGRNRGQVTQESRSSVPGIAVKYAGIRRDDPIVA